MHLVFSSLVATTQHDNTTYRDNDRFGLKKERVEEIKDEEEWRVATLGPGEGGQHVAPTPSWHSSASRAAVGAMTEIKAGAALSLAAGVDGCRENSPVPVAQAVVLCSRTRRSRAHHLT